MLRRRFKRIKKPSWQPPDWLFGPVWTVLYSMMGYASWLVYQKGGDAVPLTLYGIQLFMNLIWTPLFFKQHNLTYALADITGMQILHLHLHSHWTLQQSYSSNTHLLMTVDMCCAVHRHAWYGTPSLTNTSATGYAAYAPAVPHHTKQLAVVPSSCLGSTSACLNIVWYRSFGGSAVCNHCGVQQGVTRSSTADAALPGLDHLCSCAHLGHLEEEP